jgi:hypothetical protein
VKVLHWLLCTSIFCSLLAGCDKHAPKKPDINKGTVTGTVICADTAKPARFSSVILTAPPHKDGDLENGNPLPENETAETDLEGHFRMEAVEPGRYYAFATQEGYLDPIRGLDIEHIESLKTTREQAKEAIAEWKDHFVEVTVARGKTSEIKITIERAAEISGTVSYDDGSPAIGMHFQLYRKTERGETAVGLPLLDGWNTRTVSDGRGRFALTNLVAGEYTVCALLPSSSQDESSPVCLGNVFRRKDAKTVKVDAGESATGQEIVIPLNGLHSVSGTVTALADGHPLGSGTVRLLWADNREKARESVLTNDGSFSFPYVPEGQFLLQVTNVQETEEKKEGGDEAAGNRVPVRYAEKTMPLRVQNDVDELQVQLTPVSAAEDEKKP